MSGLNTCFLSSTKTMQGQPQCDLILLEPTQAPGNVLQGLLDPFGFGDSSSGIAVGLKWKRRRFYTYSIL
jgi:hypothetical protein